MSLWRYWASGSLVFSPFCFSNQATRAVFISASPFSRSCLYRWMVSSVVGLSSLRKMAWRARACSAESPPRSFIASMSSRSLRPFFRSARSSRRAFSVGVSPGTSVLLAVALLDKVERSFLGVQTMSLCLPGSSNWVTCFGGMLSMIFIRKSYM